MGSNLRNYKRKLIDGGTVEACGCLSDAVI